MKVSLGLRLMMSVSAMALASALTCHAADNEIDQHALFAKVAEIYSLDPELLEAIAKVESNGNATAVSRAGAQGLMQLMPGTAHRFGVRDSFDSVQNALGAARFLSWLRSWQATQPGLPGFLPEQLAAYNAGPGAVQKYHGTPPFQETRDYVRRVLRAYLLGDPGPAHVRPAAGHLQSIPPRHPTNVAAHDDDHGVLDQLQQLKRDRQLAESATR